MTRLSLHKDGRNQRFFERGFREPGALLMMAMVLALVHFMLACSGKSTDGANGNASPLAIVPAAPVSVAQASLKTVPVEVRVIGNVEAYSTVTVRAQIDGLLERVYFTEGQDV